MKKIIFILTLFLVTLTISAQVGRVYSITVDTVKGSETVYFYSNPITGGYSTLSIQALCTQVGGTTDGTMTLQGSIDGVSYSALTDATGLVKGYPNDSLTMTNGAVQLWIVEKTPINYYRIKVVGTSADTTKITSKYEYK